MNLQQVLVSANVQHAHIVDDAYNEVPNVPWEQGALQTFFDALEEAQVDRLYEVLELKKDEGDVAVEALGHPDNLTNLFKFRDEFEPHSSGLFGEYLTDQESKKQQLNKLIDFLDAYGVKCHTFGADYKLDGSEVPQMVFIDLRLREVGPVQVEDAARAFSKLKMTHSACQPFVVLMSTLNNDLAAQRDEFRRKAELFASQFEAVPKSLFENSEELGDLLHRYVAVLPRLTQLHKHIDGLDKALYKVASEVKKSILALDLADYFVLYQNTASIEKVGLGAYICDLLLEYMASEVENTDAIWDFAKDLDGWDLKDLPRSRFALTPAAAKIYTGNVLHARMRLDKEADRKLGPVEGFFYLGDIFLLTKEYNESKFTRAFVVVTPICDLVRPEDLKKETIFLCEGKVKAVTPATVPAADGGVAQVVMPNPKDPSKHLLIRWNKKLLHTWHREEIEAFADPQKCHWMRVGRLRPLYALQLQHSITADLSRIGLQRPPNVIEPHGVVAIVRGDDGRWVDLWVDGRANAAAGALSDSGEQNSKKTVYVVADTVVRSVRHALAAWLVKNTAGDTARMVRKLLDLNDFDQRLMYLAQTVPPPSADGKAVDITGYPMIGILGFNEDEQHAVAFVRPNKPSRYLSVSGGRDVTADDQACLIVKFLKVEL